ncbi:M48 family metalloprotease [Halovivax gelatinilyticus]|uniref:M48 family metalloprotease n=1 Tax=Halovivax gelatinilyticus TaxID=2961597 RepID=UPI0020CA3942|nr:M48 family metalloprotease [Halovivax gelatinilyticus]
MNGRPASARGIPVDRGLQARMVVGLALIVVFPVLFVVVLEAALGTIVPAVTSGLTGVDPGIEPVVDRRLLLVAILAGLVGQYTYGDRLALRSLDARPVTDDEYPALTAAVSRLAQQADLPVPSVAIVESEAPNAFATGRTRASTTIVVTTGLLDSLDAAERDAVLAHELAHVANRDVTVMTIAYLLPTITYLVATSAYTILRTVFHSLRFLRTGHDNDGRAVAAVIVVVVVTTIVTVAVASLFWIASFLLYRLLCRYREHAADRGAAELTGDPLALASALETIDGELKRTPDRDLRQLDGGVEALYVAPLDFAQFTEDGDDGLLSKDLFPDTHPETADRIERLRSMAVELETTEST